MKPDDQCQPITLIMRKYYPQMREKAKQYYYDNKEKINQKMRDRYKNDPEYKKKQNEARTKNQRLKKQRADEAMIASSS